MAPFSADQKHDPNATSVDWSRILPVLTNSDAGDSCVTSPREEM